VRSLSSLETAARREEEDGENLADSFTFSSLAGLRLIAVFVWLFMPAEKPKQ